MYLVQEMSLLLEISHRIIQKQKKLTINSSPEKLSSLAKYILSYKDFANGLKQTLKDKLSQRRQIISETTREIQKSISEAFTDIFQSVPNSTIATRIPNFPVTEENDLLKLHKKAMNELDTSLFVYDPRKPSVLDSLAIGASAEIEALLGENAEPTGQEEKGVSSLVSQKYGQSGHRVQSQLERGQLQPKWKSAKKAKSIGHLLKNGAKLGQSKTPQNNRSGASREAIGNKTDLASGNRSKFWNLILKNQDTFENEPKSQIFRHEKSNFTFSSSNENGFPSEQNGTETNQTGDSENDFGALLKGTKRRPHGQHKTISRVFKNWIELRINELKIRDDKKTCARREFQENMRIREEKQAQVQLPTKKLKAKLAVLFKKLLIVFCNESPSSKFLAFYKQREDSLMFREVARLEVSSLVSFIKKNEFGDLFAVGFLNKSLGVFRVHKKSLATRENKECAYHGINFDLDDKFDVLGASEKSAPRVEFLWERENVFGLKCLGFLPFDLGESQLSVQGQFESVRGLSRRSQLAGFYSKLQKKKYLNSKCRPNPSTRNRLLLEEDWQENLLFVVADGQKSIRVGRALQPAHCGVHDARVGFPLGQRGPGFSDLQRLFGLVQRVRLPPTENPNFGRHIPQFPQHVRGRLHRQQFVPVQIQ